MSKAYLAWPVKFLGVEMPKDLHITLKYLGDSPFTVEDLRKRLKGKNTTLSVQSKMHWMLTKFNLTTTVLALHDVPANAFLCKAALDDLRKSDYPGWNPHITVPKDLWDQIKKEGPTPQDLIEDIGPLTLYVDKIATFEWRTK